MFAPPLTKNYSLVGTAYDYLLRFLLEREFSMAKRRRWIAETAINCRMDDTMRKRAIQLLADATKAYTRFIHSGRATEGLFRSVLLLAQLDQIYRHRHRPERLFEWAGGYTAYMAGFGQVSDDDIEDLRSLRKITPLSQFRPSRRLILNPTFEAGLLVNGADCDLVIDDCILDIKTTKYANVDRKAFNQLVGYYLLSRLGGIYGWRGKPKIRRVGIYFSRFAEFVFYPVNEIADEQTFEEFVRGFELLYEEYLIEEGIDDDRFDKLFDAVFSAGKRA